MAITNPLLPNGNAFGHCTRRDGVVRGRIPRKYYFVYHHYISKIHRDRGLPDETDNHMRMVSRSDLAQRHTSSPDERLARFYVNPVSPDVIILPQLRRKRLKQNSKKRAKPDQVSRKQTKAPSLSKPKKSKKKPKTGKEKAPSGHQLSKVQKGSSKN